MTTTDKETTMTTETTTPAGRAKQISDRLLEIGPYPASSEAATAQELARYLAVRAAVINHQLLSPDAPFSRRQVDLLTILFAAAHALRTFAATSEAEADRAARETLNAWEDGGGIGEWLWDHLGSEACAEIGPLADEMAALAKPADGLLAHADPIRHALNRAVGDAKSANHRDAYMKALHALEEAAAEAEESQS